MEEGLDTWWELNIQLWKRNYLRFWHKPKHPRKNVDLQKYRGFKGRQVPCLFLVDSTFYYPLFKGKPWKCD